jgi:hypothetical protein
LKIIERSKAAFSESAHSPAKVRVSYEYLETAAEKAKAFIEGFLKEGFRRCT